jgi:hypothetical protein
VYHERRTVSRKTAGDGRLEITKVAAGHIQRLAEGWRLSVDGGAAKAALGSAPCTCRGPELPHVHYFLQAEGLKELPAGSQVEVEVDREAGRVDVRRV